MLVMFTATLQFYMYIIPALNHHQLPSSCQVVGVGSCCMLLWGCMSRHYIKGVGLTYILIFLSRFLTKLFIDIFIDIPADFQQQILLKCK